VLTLAAATTGSHFPIIGAGIGPLLVAVVVGASWLFTRGVERLDARYDEADVNGERDA
jgi:hypothetical protein